MSEIFRGNPSDKEMHAPKQLSRSDVERKIENNESFEGSSIEGLDLSGLSLEGKNFRSANAYDLKLYRKAAGAQAEVTTDIRGSDWTDAVLVSQTGDTLFTKVQAEGARFGFTTSLVEHRARYKEHYETTGEAPRIDKMNGLSGFTGNRGDFKKTLWKHIDFGGTSDGARFRQADFSGAVFEGCDLSEIDLSTCNLEGISLKDPAELRGLKIAEKDMLSVAQGLSFSAADAHNELKERAYIFEGDPRGFLDSYGVKVIG